MGEIADALRKATADEQRERANQGPAAAPAHVAPELAAPTAPVALERRRPGPEDEDRAPVRLDGVEPRVDLSRQVALRMRSAMEARGVRSVALVSPLRNEGKTTVACNLAIALASLSSGNSVALVDMDLRNPSVAKRLGLRVEVGIDNVLEGKASLEEIRVPLSAPNLDVFPAFEPRHAAHELLVRPTFEATVQQLHDRYEAVVFDTPPTLIVPDSTLILRYVSSCVTVAHSGVTRVRMFKKMLDLLPDNQILGKVLNGAHAAKHERDYYYYGYGAETDESTAEPSEPSPQ